MIENLFWLGVGFLAAVVVAAGGRLVLVGAVRVFGRRRRVHVVRNQRRTRGLE